MPIPSVIGDLSTTPALNSPAGSDNLSTTDDYLRSIQAILKTVYDAQATTNSGKAASGANADITSLTALASVPAVVTTALNLKADLASPTFTGTPSLPTGTTGVTQTAGDNTTKLATTAFVLANPTGLGIGQTWTNVIGSRALTTTYTNSTGKPIYVAVSLGTSGTSTHTFVIAGSTVMTTTAAAASLSAVNFFYVIPDGVTYSCTSSAGSIGSWWELR